MEIDTDEFPAVQDWALEMVEAEIRKKSILKRLDSDCVNIEKKEVSPSTQLDSGKTCSKESKRNTISMEEGQLEDIPTKLKTESCWDLRAKIKGAPQSPLTEKDKVNEPVDPVSSPSKFDLRQKLSKGFSREQEKRDVNQRGQRQRGGRVSKTRTSDGSPLRSPRNVRYNIMDMDNSCTYRNSSNRNPAQDLEGPSPQSNKRRQRGTVLKSTEKKERVTINESESDSECSRRRLQLPKEDGQLTDDCESSSEKTPYVEEKDDKLLARKEKDVQYGKSTEAYQLYIDIVPKAKRTGDLILHPKTPDKLRKCSRRSWDTQIKLWKRRIFSWVLSEGDPENNEVSSALPDSPAGSSHASMEESLKENDSPSGLPDRHTEGSDQEDDELDLEDNDIDLDYDMIKEKVKIDTSQ